MIKIGIDPDIKKSGFVWKEGKTLRDYKAVDASELLRNCNTIANSFGIENIEIRLEAGWINKKSNFRTNINKGIDQHVAKSVGQNQGFGMCISQILRGMGFKVLEVKPQMKGFMKVKGAWTPKGREYFSKISGIPKCKNLNDDVRDAVLLIL
jgi:hypothetical protein